MKQAKNRVIVTGGAGFIGSALTKSLVEQGMEVKVIDNLARGKLSNLQENGEPVIDIANDFIQGDLKDYQFCLDSIKDVDCVIHLADIVGGINYIFDHQQFVFRENILINSNVLAACVHNKIPNYTYVGTACSYPQHLQNVDGICQLVEDQTYPAHPESSYGWSKLMGEYEATLAMEAGSLNVGLVRLHNVYGPGSSYSPTDGQVIPSLMRKAINFPDEPFIVWGSGQQYRDFLYVDDAVNGIILTAFDGLNKGLIQFGSEVATTIKEVAETVVHLSEKKIEIGYDLDKPEGDRGRIANCERARTVLGWEAQWPISKGLKETFDWVKANMEAETTLADK